MDRRPSAIPRGIRWKVRPTDAFTDNVTGEPCAICGTRVRHVVAHHITPQQKIRVHVRGIPMDPEDRRYLHIHLLSDPRNRLWLCDFAPLACHPQLEAHRLTVYRDQIPASAFEFAAELGEPFVAWLEKRHPINERRAA